MINNNTELETLKYINMKNYLLCLILILLLGNSTLVFSQSETKQKEIALQIINNAKVCSLISIDNEGYPAARMMQTLPVEEDFIVWLGTKNITNKVDQIKNNPKVSVYYMESETSGYVNMQGIAEIVTDKENKDKHWKKEWKEYYPNKKNDFVLIKITPLKIQMVSYENNIISKSEDWKAKEIIFP